MTYAELKDAIWELVSEFFCGATVIWSEQINTTPKLPYITLKTNGIMRDVFVSERDGVPYYNASTTLEMNLYTKGKPMGDGSYGVTNYVNTATSDLADFFKYLDSDYGLTEQEKRGITVMLTPPIRDLTEIQNDRMYRYRAYCESTVSFADIADGKYGLLDVALPTAGGGGNNDMASTQIDVIEQVEIKEVTNNE